MLKVCSKISIVSSDSLIGTLEMIKTFNLFIVFAPNRNDLHKARANMSLITDSAREVFIGTLGIPNTSVLYGFCKPQAR